jgi:hypothetical protein
MPTLRATKPEKYVIGEYLDKAVDEFLKELEAKTSRP